MNPQRPTESEEPGWAETYRLRNEVRGRYKSIWAIDVISRAEDLILTESDDEPFDGPFSFGQVLLHPTQVAKDLPNGLIGCLASLEFDYQPSRICFVLSQEINVADLSAPLVTIPFDVTSC